MAAKVIQCIQRQQTRTLCQAVRPRLGPNRSCRMKQMTTIDAGYNAIISPGRGYWHGGAMDAL